MGFDAGVAALAHGAALSRGGQQLGTAGEGLALDLIAQSHAAVTHAHPARLGLPDVVVEVHLPVHGAVLWGQLV